MKANYHTHTYRCNHAIGNEEEYIRQAIDNGLEILGFSDHTPYPYRNGYSVNWKMSVDDTDGYFDTLLSLREKYREYIDIKIGFETELYPKIFPDLLELYKKYPIDYIINGQHFVGTESVDSDCFSAFEEFTNERLVRYADTLIDVMNTGLFTYLAHPDCPRFMGDREFYDTQMSRIICRAEETGTPLEINLLGLSEKRNYPDGRFWELARGRKVKAVLGCDAHSPDRVAKKKEVEDGLRFADKYCLEIIDKLHLIDPNAR